MVVRQKVVLMTLAYQSYLAAPRGHCRASENPSQEDWDSSGVGGTVDGDLEVGARG